MCTAHKVSELATNAWCMHTHTHSHYTYTHNDNWLPNLVFLNPCLSRVLFLMVLLPDCVQIETESHKKVLANLEKITEDYQQMKKENSALAAKLKQK